MSSPWRKIEIDPPMTMREIMSEEYARTLQTEENSKNVELIERLILDDEHTNYGLSPGDQSATSVLGIHQNDKEISETTNNFVLDTSNDMAIASALQEIECCEHDAEILRLEKKMNGNSKVITSLRNYRFDPIMPTVTSDETRDELHDDPNRDWDCFDTNQKKFTQIPRTGYKIDTNGEYITKHDAQICGVRNTCRIMNFPPEVNTGDAAIGNIAIPNRVFNNFVNATSSQIRLKKLNNKTKAIAKNSKPTRYGSYDEVTNTLLSRLFEKVIVDMFVHLACGKEASIYCSTTHPLYINECFINGVEVPQTLAVKIYKTNYTEANFRDQYLCNDHRFKSRYNKKNRNITELWAEREALNLDRLHNAGVHSPYVYERKGHILVMTYIGDEENPAPQLKNVNFSSKDLPIVYNEIIGMMHAMYNKAELVHSDLSEYNILYHNKKCVFIDVPQAMLSNSKGALTYLMRDCKNILKYFSDHGFKVSHTGEQLFHHITGLDVFNFTPEELEKLQMRKNSVSHNNEILKEDSGNNDFEWQWEIEQKSKSQRQNVK